MTYGYCSMSSGWLSIFSCLIRMTKRHLNPKSSGWVSSWQYLIRMTFGHCSMSSGWHIIPPYVIRMSYDNVIMSSGWHTLQLLSHPDEIANFDFPQHAVALQRFRIVHNQRLLVIDITQLDCLKVPTCAAWGSAAKRGLLKQSITHQLARSHFPKITMPTTRKYVMRSFVPEAVI